MVKIKHIYELDNLAPRKAVDSTTFVPVTTPCGKRFGTLVGTPGIVAENMLTGTGREIPVLLSFPVSQSRHNRNMPYIPDTNLHVLPPKNLIHNHRVKMINEFKSEKIHDIADYVKEHASITLTFSDPAGAARFIEKIPSMHKSYKHIIPYNFRKGVFNARTATFKFIPFVHFIDLPYCISIFDGRKVDGIGIRCGFLYLKNTGDPNYACMTFNNLYFILSNYKDNLLYVDGVKIRTECNIEQSTIGHMLSIIKDERALRETPSVVPKKKTTGNSKIIKSIEVADSQQAEAVCIASFAGTTNPTKGMSYYSTSTGGN